MQNEFLNRVKMHYDVLSDKEKKSIDLIIENIEEVKDYTIQDVSKLTNSSISSISRLVRKLEFSNFQEMKFKINQVQSDDAATHFLPEVTSKDSSLKIGETIFRNGISSLQSTISILNEESLDQAISFLGNHKRAGIFGLGASAVIALHAYHRFIRSSLHCIYAPDYHMQLMNCGQLHQGDAALIISHTGKNNDIIRIAKILKEKGVSIIAITSNKSSPLSKLSDVVLITISDETNYQPEALSSSTTQMLLIDTLFMGYAIKVDDDSQYFADVRSIINTTRN